MATSKLKRKLEIADNNAYGNVNESFVAFGTALPSLADSRDSNEFKPAWEQEVRDEKGRRRFHGAFTGGFSAGYFNTVGSKEGWTPSTFKSSRTMRAGPAQPKTARELALDFMDDEDRQDFAASQNLKTSAAFSSTSKATHMPAAPDPFESILRPSSSRKGAELMRKMGWREGTGTGPRVTLEQRRKQVRDYGRSDVSMAASENADPSANEFYYAPLDSPAPAGPSHRLRSGSTHGLGHVRSNLEKMAEIDEIDEVDDDFAMRAGTRQSSQDAFVGARFVRGRQEGATSSRNDSTSLLPPPPPPGWQPSPTRFFKHETLPLTSQDASSRGRIYEEAEPSVVAKSVLEFLSQKDRERLQLAKQKMARQDDEPSAFAHGQLSLPQVPAGTALAALKGFQPFSATSSSPDPVRQARYTLFLKFFAGELQGADSSDKAQFPYGPRTLPDGTVQTIEQLNKELEDYARSALVFRPVSGMLAGRFTTGQSASATSEARVSTPGLHLNEGLSQPGPPPSSGHDSADTALTPRQRAVRDGSFGASTRATEIFRPARLVCKRFGVRDPWQGEAVEEEGVGQAWKEPSKFGFGTVQESNRTTQDLVGQETLQAMLNDAQAFGGHGTAPRRDEGEGGEDELRDDAATTAARPPADLFAAIFADSSDESESEDGAGPPPASNAPETALPDITHAVSKGAEGDERSGSFRPMFSKPVSTPTSTGKPRTKKRKQSRISALSFDAGDDEDSGPKIVVENDHPRDKRRAVASDLF